MTLSDPQVYRNIIGCLMKKPTLRLEYNFRPEDFDLQIFQGIFAIISRLINEGFNTSFNEINLDLEIHSTASPSFSAIYDKYNGVEILKDCMLISDLDTFDYYYQNLKKNALLRDYRRMGFNISYFFVEAQEGMIKDESVAIEHYNNATVESIIGYYESQQNSVSAKYLNDTKKGGDAAAGIHELLADLKARPNVGADLEGEIFNHACRGARRGCFYLKSAASSVGKTRCSVFDACKLAYPIRYQIDKRKGTEGWVYDSLDGETIREPEKTLFIVTEMDKDEIQTIILAYLSKVNEEHILTNSYEIGEEERVRRAAQVMEMYPRALEIQAIADPNLTNIESMIKKFAVVDKVTAVFFDYIHTSPGLLSQFQANGIGEHTVLMMLSNELKQLAKDYNLFIMSATQVNATGMEDNGDFKNETCIRGAKAVADKCDIGFVMSQVKYSTYQTIFQRLGGQAKNVNHVTHVIDIYKMRRGRYKNVRIYINLDLGTGERHDLFMTTADGEFIELDHIDATTMQLPLEWGDII